ncbi:hypothetical protein DFR59_11270 [Falsibacillus pallidus]|uniref:Uncharacterized protein n=1 Tax=Falsibacillus pallidus TaxID=493781 RepID=A0A370GCG9_9BACI|nr:hypothetical protein DFR59_11270 [Falsibacillus pallidus]
MLNLHLATIPLEEFVKWCNIRKQDFQFNCIALMYSTNEKALWRIISIEPFNYLSHFRGLGIRYQYYSFIN